MNRELLNNTLNVIPDYNIRNFIFGTGDIRKEDIENYISNMNNLIIFAFFSYYRMWESFAPTNPALDDFFTSVYTTRHLTLELISYLIGEIQVEVSKNDDSLFKGLICGNIDESKVAAICELIMQWKKSYNDQMMDVSKLREYYHSLLDTFCFLNKASLSDDYILTIGEKDYDLSIFIKITDDDDYYLYSIEDDNLEIIRYYISYTRRKFIKDIIPKRGTSK